MNPQNLVVFGGILIFGWVLLKMKTTLIRKLLKDSIDQGKIDAVNKVTSLLVFFLIGMLLLEQTGSSINTLLAFGGISGLAIAFASQQIIANFFGGIQI